MRFELEETNRGASDEELLADLRRCAKQLGGRTVTPSQYRTIGRFHEGIFAKRLGSWVSALQRAGLRTSRSASPSDEQLFTNIRTRWVALGRQPRYREMRRPQSDYSFKVYRNRFGSWPEALSRFVEWANSVSTSDAAPSEGQAIDFSVDVVPHVERRSPREVSERQRFRILLRDGFQCQSCGASPLRTPGTELHVDHILPWSSGGETVDSNLQSKCSRCNLGKNNAFHA